MIKKLILLLLIVCSVSYSQDWYKTHKKKNDGLTQLIANPNTVVWARYMFNNSMLSDSTNFGSTDSSTTTTVYAYANRDRNMQGYGLPNDKWTQFQIDVKDYTKIKSFVVIAGRRNELTGTMTQIGSHDITSLMIANGNQMFPIDIPNLKEGDYLGFKFRTDGYAFCLKSGNGNHLIIRKDNADSVNVTFSTTVANSYVPMYAYGNAPIAVCFGNSLTGGSPNHYPYTYPIQIAQINRIDWTYPFHAFSRYGITYQNAGFPGQSLDSLKENFFVSVALKYPRQCYLENTNELNVATSAEAIQNFKDLVDSCVTHDIQPVYIEIPPKNVTIPVLLRKDTINNAVSPYVLSKGGIVIRLDTALGVVTDSGTIIKTGWSPDGIHYNDFSYYHWGNSAHYEMTRHYRINDTSTIDVSDSTSFDTTVYSPKTFYANVYSYWKRPDSVVVQLTIEGGDTIRTLMSYRDSLGVSHTSRHSGTVTIPAEDGDSVKYRIAAYGLGKVGYSGVGSFRYGERQPYRTNMVIEWNADSSGTNSEWQSLIDTLKARQNTVGNQPTLMANRLNGHNAYRFDSTKYFTFTPKATVTTNYTFMFVVKRIGTNGLAGYLLGGTGQGAVLNFDVASYGIGLQFSSGNYLITAPSTDTNWMIITMTSTDIYKNGVEVAYALEQAANAMTLSMIGDRPGALTLFLRAFIAYIAVWSEKLSDANRGIHEAYINGYYGVH